MKNIFQNTIVIYFKLFTVSLIGLFLSSYTLSLLGSNNFGLFSVIGGIVGIVNLLSLPMSAACTRYLSIELGKGDGGNANRVFNSLLFLHLIITIIFYFASETLGVWYVIKFLNIPSARTSDALFVLHFSVFATCLSILGTPFRGLLVAKERFIVTSLSEVFISLFKLFSVLLLSYSLTNKLRGYTVIIGVSLVLQPIFYILYGRIKEAQITKWKINKGWSDYKEMVIFSFWALQGGIGFLAQAQGVAVLLNSFFGTLINAAYGIASQVNMFVMMFVKSLSEAFIPQIMKNSERNSDHSLFLVYRISKYSSLLMLVVLVPMTMSIKFILSLWLNDVPDFTSHFVIFMLINGQINCLSSGFDALIQATGKIRINQIGYGILNIAILPISYVLLKNGYPPFIVSVVSIFSTILIFFFQLNVLLSITKFRLFSYARTTMFPVLLVVTSLLPLVVFHWLYVNSEIGEVIFMCISVFWTLLSAYFIGLDDFERGFFVKVIVNRYFRKQK